jgi:hypothetical protein
MFIVSYLKTIAFCVSLVFLHSSYAAAASDSSFGNPAEIIKDTAIEVHHIARTPAPARMRLIFLTPYINALQVLSQTLIFKPSDQRYLILLECFAWDFYELLLRDLGSQRVFIDPITRGRPSVALAAEYVRLVIAQDIKNPALKEILSKMSIASTERNREKYEELAEQLEHLGKTLSGAEKREFELYRMVLGPQYIESPIESTTSVMRTVLGRSGVFGNGLDGRQPGRGLR